MGKRIDYIDAVKCFAITLVVLGHVIQNILFRDTYESLYLYRFIYAFHMPLFMMVSGYFAHNYLTLRKDCFRLLVPYVMWAVVTAIQYRSVTYLWKVFLYPDNGLWFLWVLFFVKAIYASAFVLERKFHIAPVAFIAGVFVILSGIQPVIGPLFCISSIARYLVFFSIGGYLKNRQLPNNKQISTGGVLLCY